jgi:hypothetical protein
MKWVIVSFQRTALYHSHIQPSSCFFTVIAECRNASYSHYGHCRHQQFSYSKHGGRTYQYVTLYCGKTYLRFPLTVTNTETKHLFGSAGTNNMQGRAGESYG